MRVIVQRCTACPFFRKTWASVLATRGDPNAGTCCAPTSTKAGEVTLASSRPVDDSRELPMWCPMRMGDIVVTIGTRGTA